MQLRNMTPGYAALGAYLFSQAMWLAREVRQNGYARVNFLARDGYYVKAAFERLNEVLRLPVETGYVRISRQAALPLQFSKAIDLLSLPLLIDMTAHTPDSLLTLLHPIASERAQTALAAELPMNQRMDARTQWNFVRIFREKGMTRKNISSTKRMRRRICCRCSRANARRSMWGTTCGRKR